MKNKFLILFSVLILTSCDVVYHSIKELTIGQKEKIAYLESFGLEPYTQYGLVYRIGNFGGVPVMLDEAYDRETKYSAEIVRHKSSYNPPPEDFHNLISSIWVEARYTDGVNYVGYHKAPRDIVEQYNNEQKNPHHAWVSIHFSNYYKPLESDYIVNNNNAKDILDKKRNYEFHKVYIYAGQEYGLEKYVLDERSRNYYANLPYRTSPTDTEDIYFSRDTAGNYIDIIECSNHHRPMSRQCNLYFVYKLNSHVFIRNKFQREHLKDWQKIKKLSIDKLKAIVVKDKDILKRIEEHHRAKP